MHIGQQNISYDIKPVGMLILIIQRIEWDLSMMKISYKLTKTTTKTEKFEKALKMYNIINSQTIRYKLSASVNIIHSIFNYKLMRPVSTLRLPKENRQKQQIRKKESEKSVKAIEK